MAGLITTGTDFLQQSKSKSRSRSNFDQASRSQPMSQSVKGGWSPGNIGRCRTFIVARWKPSIWAVAATQPRATDNVGGSSS
jgi:hypothetical protein